MRREILKKMVEWKELPDDIRKPLILEGARQVGKTWLARELGKSAFKNYVEVNFEDMEEMRSLFEADFDINRILMAIQSTTGQKIVAGETLLFFDEIQHARRGLLSLKYFREKAPQYHVVAAGSLLGVIDHKDDSFPVGKVDFLNVFPLSFEEFLNALGKEGLTEILKSNDPVSINAFSSQFADLLRQYYYVGGMPEAVLAFVNESDYKAVRKVQLSILKSYEHDFSKHPPKEIAKRMSLLWNAIPSQLAKENKKFIYSAIKSGARGRDYETAVQWLCDAGMAYKVTRVKTGDLPLAGFEDADSFKLYVLDIGLHGAMAGLSARSLMQGNGFLEQYKGALTEQYVLQELMLFNEVKIHYWTPDQGIAEVDFVIQMEDTIIPIEVKAERNLQAKSLKEFVKRYKPESVIRTSMASYEKGNNIIDLPLYAFSLLPKLVGQETD